MMALRNQPYFPLYVQDYMTDEKLNLCSWQTQGIYIKILCILHKQKEYGCILFKQNDKQNQSTCLDFASILVRNLPCQLNEMVEALEELIENEVLIIQDNKLFQKRMYKDGKISEERSKAGKKGGGNPNLFKHNPKQNDKQNPEYEYEDDIEVKYKKGIDSEKEKYEEYTNHLRKQSVKERLAMNNGIGQKEIDHVINEFIDTCYGEMVLKPTRQTVEQYFINWVRKENRVTDAINNQLRKNERIRQITTASG